MSGVLGLICWPAQMLRQHIRTNVLEMAQPGAWYHATGAPLGHGGLLNAKKARGGRSASDGVCDKDGVVHASKHRTTFVYTSSISFVWVIYSRVRRWPTPPPARTAGFFRHKHRKIYCLSA